MIKSILILGSGTSTGVPVLGCNCKVCISDHPKNKRTRSSILIQTNKNKHILVDTGPDLRLQLLREKIQHIDEVILTHEHADHLHGIDDLRPLTYFQKTSINVHTRKAIIPELKTKFPYIFDRTNYFKTQKVIGGGVPLLSLIPVSLKKAYSLLGENFYFVSMPHGTGRTLGIIHKKFAYFIDNHMIPQWAIDKCKQLKIETLIIDCVKYTPHKTHLHFDKSISYIEQIKPKNAYLTHLGDQFNYPQLVKELKKFKFSSIKPAHDGLRIKFSV
ncbi:MBL fold metallo-hydrolase [Bacteriovoracaceae bacterium]|nr:MBL fold metallo-hydrolase [Bacteriovoracaceae bacterium]